MSICKICGGTFSYCAHFTRPRREPRAAPATMTRASDAMLDLVYRGMLQVLPLEPHHRQALRSRGPNDGEIVRRGYRTLPLRGRSRIAQELVARFGAEVCAGIPGLYQRDGNGGRFWTAGGSPGLLIPVRDLRGNIVALKIRTDTDQLGGKYRSLSSTAHGGPGPGANVHVAMCDGADHREIRVTEGELAADVCAALTRTLTISIPGVAMWRKALATLEAIRPETILLALDQDWTTNTHVARAMLSCATAVKVAGYRLFVETWPPEHKGIDDALAAGHPPERKPFEAVYAARMRAPTRQIRSLGSMIHNRV